MAAPFMQPIICPVLIGRTLQLDALRQLLERVSGGSGQVLLIAGEAGIGKSRMVAEAKAYAAACGFVLLQGACFPQDSVCPYAPLLDLLRTRFAGRPPAAVAAAVGPFAHDLAALLPDQVLLPDDRPAAPALDPAQQQRRMFAALAHCLTRRVTPQPLLLIVEDLHWSDEGTLDFLLYLLRRSAAEPLLLIGTYRSDEVGPQLSRWLAQLDREHVSQELPLAPLARDEVAAMLRAIFALDRPARAEFLDSVYSLTEGNPFYVEELLKSLVMAGDIFYAGGSWDRKPIEELRIPRSLHNAVQQRVARLSDDARRLAALAAVVGRRFDFALLQRLAHLDESDLLRLIKELIAAQLVVEETDERFAFRHALTRQAIYAGLLARERAALHRTIAETTEQVYADALDAHTADLSYHFYEAAVWEKALSYARRAGERAQALGAPHAAIEQLTRALDAAGKIAETPDPALHLARGHAYETVGDFACARDDYEVGLRLARAAHDSAAEWQSLIAMGLLWASRDYQQTGEWLHSALELAQAIGDLHLLAQSLNRLGNWQVNTGEATEGLRLHEQALALSEAQGDRQGMADTLDLLGMANGLYGDILRSIQWYDHAIALFRALGNIRGLVEALTSRSSFANSVTEPVCSPYWSYDDSARDIAEALRLARQIDWPAGQAHAEMTAGVVCQSFGLFGVALAHARAALEIATSIEHRQWIVGAYCTLGEIYITLLAPDQAIRDLTAGLSLAHALGSEFWIAEISSVLAQAYLLNHDLARAESALATAMPRDQTPHGKSERWMTLTWGQLALAQGASEQALHIAEQLIDTAPGAVRGPIPVLLKLKGEALLALGCAEESAHALEQARSGAEKHGARPLLWQILRSLGQAYQRLGQKQAAQGTYAAARAIVDSLTATIDDAELRDGFLRAAQATLPLDKPLTARRAAAERFGGLTARERAVAKQIAQGRSNREVAEALVISEKTVETHVSNILSKLGCASRLQIATWATTTGLLDDPE